MRVTQDEGSPAPPFARIAIVGVGLIGGSLGLAIRHRWPVTTIVAIDRAEVVQTALRLGAADIGGDGLGLARDADLVVLAAPVRTNIALLSRLPTEVSGQALVTDVGSTKREIVSVSCALPARLRFVGGHPLAGGTAMGVEAGRSDLFAGRPWILTPADGEECAGLRRLLEGIGAAVLVQSPEAHDALVAAMSHLPQFAATALMHVVGERIGTEGLGLAGRGLRDTTRLAASSTVIWRDIAATNRDNIRTCLDALIAVLQDLKGDLDDERGALTRTFESASRWKQILGAEQPQDAGKGNRGATEGAEGYRQ